MKEWRYIKPLPSEGLISELEESLGYKFVDSYIDTVKKYNGARPPKSVFKVANSEEKTIKSFLSLNSSDTENIVNSNKIVSNISENIFAFAIDNFGNYICFDINDNKIYFLDFETGDLELVCEDFVDFLKMLE